MVKITQRVRDVQVRQQRQWIWQCVSAGLLAGGAIGTSAAVIRILTQGAFSWMWVAACVLTPVIVAASAAVVKGCSMQLAARTIDSQCGLKDRTQTALQFLASSSTNDALRRLQVEDAELHLQAVDPVKVAPIRAPRFWGWGIMLTVMACVLTFLSGQPLRLQAAVETNSVVAAQAERVADGLEELKQFQNEQKDPELEKILEQIARQLQELKEPGLEPKEALAKLSEMEAALQEMQRQVTDVSIAAELQEIGETLSLAESMATAGQAMAKGELEKAAEELAKLDLPKLDRKTEKAIREKLEQIQKDQGNDSQKQGLKEALNKTSEGLSSGNKDKFQDGMKSLASECKKQGQKKKLSDLLKKQCKSLSESKSEIEGESRAQAQSNKKGGSKAGKGSAELTGEKTARQKTGTDMNLKGQDSGSGDSGIEAEQATEQEQEAVRRYRENADKYEALSESVLESESIPPGHRQTIRRYFEMIRPTAAETDSVNSQTDSKP
ncbi:MAG TPA: hypothetical protein PLR25_10580 [Planctomycetaceae bacterium]|nr:hypothetical protein [Planctomycetaceae bacterium]